MILLLTPSSTLLFLIFSYSYPSLLSFPSLLPLPTFILPSHSLPFSSHTPSNLQHIPFTHTLLFLSPSEEPSHDRWCSLWCYGQALMSYPLSCGILSSFYPLHTIILLLTTNVYRTSSNYSTFTLFLSSVTKRKASMYTNMQDHNFALSGIYRRRGGDEEIERRRRRI